MEPSIDIYSDGDCTYVKSCIIFVKGNIKVRWIQASKEDIRDRLIIKIVEGFYYAYAKINVLHTIT